MPIGHRVLHGPQFFASIASVTSQPLAAPPSQSAKPILHDWMPHAPPMHPGVPFATAPHVLPQAPQLLASVARFFSQPSAATPLQSAQGALHMPMPHVPALQAAVAFDGIGHTLPHRPQFAVEKQ